MAFVLAALVLWGVPAAATPRWEVPSVCPEQGEVEAWIDRLALGVVEQSPDWQGRVEGTPESGFVLTLTVSGRTRTVSDSDCGKLAIAAALVVAVAADPVAVADTIEPVLREPEPDPRLVESPQTPEPVEVGPSPVVKTPGPESQQTAPRDTATGLSALVSAAVGAELAVLPRPGFGASVAGGIVWAWLRLELVGVVSVPRDIEARESNLGARAAVAGGQVRGCWVVRAKPVEVPVCLAGEVGAVWARGFGPGIEPQAKVQPWAAAVPSLGVTGWLSQHVGLEARISVPVGLYKPAVHLVGGTDTHVFRAGAAGARLWVGPVVRFP